jgi:hypothetical protein
MNTCLNCKKPISVNLLRCYKSGCAIKKEYVTVIEADEAEASLTTEDIYLDQYSDTYGTF